MDNLINSWLNDKIEKVIEPPAPVIEPPAPIIEPPAPIIEPTTSADSYRPNVGEYLIYEVLSKVDGYEYYTCRYKNSNSQLQYIYYFVFIFNFSLLARSSFHL